MNKFKKDTTYAGIDLGTNTSTVFASMDRADAPGLTERVPTLVGRVPDDSILEFGDAESGWLFGDAVVENYDHVEVMRPVEDGVISDSEAARLFMGRVRSMLDDFNPGKAHVAVVGAPAKASDSDVEALEQVIDGYFEAYWIVPEPFLAVVGFRDVYAKKDAGLNLLRNCLTVDIGAGTTDLCRVQGKRPGEKDQISFPVAGDWLDKTILEHVGSSYSGFDMDLADVRAVKEKFASTARDLEVEEVVVIKGKGRKIQFGEAISSSVWVLVERILESVVELIEKSPSRMSFELLQNIYLTGGGGMIEGLDKTLQDELEKRGFAGAKVTSVGKNYWKYVGMGAWLMAKGAKDRDWKVSL